MNRLQGFTIIEALVAIFLFGLISIFLFSTFFSSVKLNQQAQTQIGSSTQAQQILETIRSAWSVSGGTTSSNYDYACVPGTLPSGYTAQFFNLSSRAEYVSSSNTVVTTAPSPNAIRFSGTAACSAAAYSTVTSSGGTATSPAMRRIVVFSGTGTGPQDTTLTLDILAPQ